MARLNLDTPFDYNGETIDHLHVLRRYWASEDKAAFGESVNGVYKVLYALHCQDTGNILNPNSDCRKMFTRSWGSDAIEAPWGKSDKWIHENNGEYTGTYIP